MLQPQGFPGLAHRPIASYPMLRTASLGGMVDGPQNAAASPYFGFRPPYGSTTALYPPSLAVYHPHAAALAALYAKHDPRLRFLHEEPKPSHSYIGLIAMAILSSPEHKLVLSDIYQWILDNYPYFRSRGPGWRNSIRHNLSLNDCFVKTGRSANGKGHYWAVHPANVEDFKKGDFRRRRAQRRVRKHMGLDVPNDDEDEDEEEDVSISPVALSPSNAPSWPDRTQDIQPASVGTPDIQEEGICPSASFVLVDEMKTADKSPEPIKKQSVVTKKRAFDIDSILAPDENQSDLKKSRRDGQFSKNSTNTFQRIPRSPSLPRSL